MPDKETVILAYSGGLDTSCILKWLLKKNYKIICYAANVGQEEDFVAVKEKALKIGASDVIVEDLQETFVENYVWPSIQCGLIYESRYLLGTSLSRPCISVGLVRCAQQNNAKYIAHGATGKGNDQVRFELSCYSLWPNVQIIAPWRMTEFIEEFRGRQDLLKYAAQNEIPVSATPKAPWSMDANVLHISYESGILENPNEHPPKDMYQMTTDPEEAPNEPVEIEIRFKQGIPVLLKTQDNKCITKSLEILQHLNMIGGKNGVGRIDIVENRFVGLKSRGIYETPGGFILHVAHTDLEVFCLDKEVYRVKQRLRDSLSDYVYNGFWFAPEAIYVRECIQLAEKMVTGVVNLKIYKGNVTVLGRSSPISLYNEDLVSMDQHSGYSSIDATGFINIHAVRLEEYNRIVNQNGISDM